MSCGTPELNSVGRFRIRGCHPLWRTFPDPSALQPSRFYESITPTYIAIPRFRLFPFRSPLLRESIVFFLFLRVMRCFSSPGAPPYTIDSCTDTKTFLLVSSLIRKSVDQSSFTTPHSLSQLVTSFFGVKCQGIHPTLFVA